MAVDSCSTNVYMSNGFDTVPPTGTKIWALHDALHTNNPTWSIDLSGQGQCTLNATTSTTGRIVNGVSLTNACNSYATVNTGAFLHIQQDPNQRNTSTWIAAINSVWP